MALRLACGVGIHLAGLKMPVRRNLVGPQIAARHEAVSRVLASRTDAEQHHFFLTANQILWEMALRGGIARTEGDPIAYRPLRRTFYSFQEKAQYPIASRGVVDQLLTLEDLLTPAGELVLQQRPDIAKKLVVFFTLVYRYFLETDHVVDLRPDNVGRDLFVKGIWGYSTRNVLITLGHDHDGAPIHAIRFVDNKDQFKQYNRAEDRSHPVGLAKHGLRLLHTLVQPSMERSIGLYIQKVAQLEGLAPDEAAAGAARGARVTQHVVREGVDGLLVYLGAFLRDLVDDTVDGIARRIKPR